MNPLRRLAALPLTLILFWAMVVAPAAYARCVHAGGETHLHVIGAACEEDDSVGVGECPDKKHDGGEKTGKAGDPPACSLVQGDDASPKNDDPSPKAPAPAIFIAVYPAFLATPFLSGDPGLPPVANAPPVAPPRRTHGRGALPLLS